MQLHLEFLDLHLAAVVDDCDVLDERLGCGVCGKRGLVAPSLADEEDAGARCRREYVVGNATVLLERSGGQFLCSGKSVIEASFLCLKEAV